MAAKKGRMPMQNMTVKFEPFQSQKPGTGGLRRPTREFMQPHYIEGFVQAALSHFRASGMAAGTLVLGSDGRYPGREKLPSIIKVLLANDVKRIIIAGREFVATTPAVSNIIRKYGADGGFMLSASHNPAGIDGDFGIKIETPAGGQPAEAFTNGLYERTLKNDSYQTLGISDEEALARAEIIDAASDYIELMKSMFDFDAIKKWFDQGHEFRFDCMNASTGECARRIFVDIFGAPSDSILRGDALADFGGIHPEPNPSYNKEFYDFMMNGGADFGAASDGDGDRNMILGNGFFAAPPDALAVMTLNYKHIPYYRDRLTGVIRSLPTSSAVDLVAEDLGLAHFATPTGWKWFVSLMDAGLAQLCGEESFGQGGDHIREKDAIFAVLYWLNMMGATGKTPRELVHDMWAKYGRTFYSQYSFGGVDRDKAEQMMIRAASDNIAGKFGVSGQEVFNYTDPATGEKSDNQGVQFFTEDNARIFARLSGTGTKGATVRLYVEKHERDSSKFSMPNREYLADICDRANKIFRIEENFGAVSPIVAI
ncbi:MAG: alpha-D-glucose phosphate-specific phosphoglucomutase [Rickettsiales bacterium]|jgi:phosphoglucomutase|nr:alpha-D-glucose phosphate-specific phosphoglucomutase [Rickettsiales bacterium]